MPGYHAGRSPPNKGQRYPADPPTVAEIVAVMRHAATSAYGARLRALIVMPWRAGLHINEALALREADLDARRGPVLLRRGKGDRRRKVGIDDSPCEQLPASLTARVQLPVGPLLCIATGRTEGAHGHRAPHAPNCASPPPARACGDGSRHMSFAMRTPPGWPAKACPHGRALGSAGRRLLAPGEPWPKTNRGNAMWFLAGLDLADLGAERIDDAMPAAGWLLFYADLGDDVDVYECRNRPGADMCVRLRRGRERPSPG